MVLRWFDGQDRLDWVVATRDFSLQILPLLFGGVLVVGFLLGRPGHEALIPTMWVAGFVGSNSIGANFFAAISGALMYFATLTEIPIMQGLLGAGMGKGPALALLLAGPSLSLPSMLVISGELGWKKTLTYVGLVVVLSTAAGMAFGYFSGSSRVRLTMIKRLGLASFLIVVLLTACSGSGGPGSRAGEAGAGTKGKPLVIFIELGSDS